MTGVLAGLHVGDPNVGLAETPVGIYDAFKYYFETRSNINSQLEQVKMEWNNQQHLFDLYTERIQFYE